METMANVLKVALNHFILLMLEILHKNVGFFTAEGENECRRNEDCRQSEVCHTGSCLNACLVFKCAPFATCATTVHDIRCTCLPGYTGDGRNVCNRSKFVLNALHLISHHVLQELFRL